MTTVEYDPEVTSSAREALLRAGLDGVTVVCGDGMFGYTDNAPYDRIIVTAGAWDVPAAWWDQLADDGVLLAPLRSGVDTYRRDAARGGDTAQSVG